MSTPQTTRPSRFMEFITTPWVDKTIAVIAITPNAIELYHRYTDVNLSFVRAVAGIQTMILIVTMVFRRTPVRVTPNPRYWLLAFVATYGLIAFLAFAPIEPCKLSGPLLTGRLHRPGNEANGLVAPF